MPRVDWSAKRKKQYGDCYKRKAKRQDNDSTKNEGVDRRGVVFFDVSLRHLRNLSLVGGLTVSNSTLDATQIVRSTLQKWSNLWLAQGAECRVEQIRQNGKPVRCEIATETF